LAFYPALDVTGLDTDPLLVLIDDFSPLALQEQEGTITVFFSSAAVRDAAGQAIRSEHPSVRLAPREVDDEDWARRSQQDLQPVQVGRLTILPSADGAASSPAGGSALPEATTRLVLRIPPSMGFGTGHHATTRLCLALLQQVALAGAEIVDVGTGSGILALAARLLGARRAVGIDVDADAIQAANDNLARNPAISGVRFECAGLATWLSGRNEPADILVANLTGALLAREAARLVAAVRPGGQLILSGLLNAERPDVAAAFLERTRLLAEPSEEEWTALLLEKPAAENRRRD
jgi:ribosomal protein L11 methyltransferase